MKVIAIVGPTAVGKTSLSIELAKQFNGEIISGDSMQVYRGLDIGTAKVTAEEMEGIPHHLIDVRDVDESYSAADFQKAARKAIQEISDRGKLPIIVGGTGLYIQSLLWDYKLGNEGELEDDSLRAKYEAFAEENGNLALWEKLQLTDPLAAEKIHCNNRKKMIRALEVFELTGHSILEPKEQPKELYDSFLIVCIINGKIIIISDAVCMSAKNSHTSRMEGRHPDTSPVQTYDLIHTLSHFLSSLICKGNSKNIPGVYSLFCDQIGDSVSQYSRFA